MTKPNPTFITEPEREITVIKNPDLLVVGGGPAGTAAALAASRCGLKSLIVERYNHLGGLWTSGLVLPCFPHIQLTGWKKNRRSFSGSLTRLSQD